MDGGDNGTLTQTRTPTTRKSLLDDLAQNPDSERLDEFARLYEPVMRRYAMRAQVRLRHGLGEAERDDLVQEAFVAVRRALAQFRYDPSRGKFRNYLSLTIRNLAWRFQRKSAATRLADSETLAALAESNDGAQSDAEARELMLSVWSVAYALVVAKRGFTPNTLAIFRSHVLEDNPVDQVAAEFKVKTNAVYQIKDRILRAVRAEIASAQASGGLVELHEELLRRADALAGKGDK
jgi:RNA polymerase sigma-70 factor (ECF subfamily)